MSETTLHQQLKALYAVAGGQTEVNVDGYLIDVFTADRLIEIQTRNFSALRPKLEALLPGHNVRVVYPIAQEKWLVKEDSQGALVERRRSPLRGRWEYLFQQFIYLPALLHHPNFSLEVVLVVEEELRRDDGKGSWRRGGWSIRDRRILTILEQRIFEQPADLLDLLPDGLGEQFTTHELAKSSRIPDRLAYKMIYALHRLELIRQDGRRGRSRLYRRSPDVCVSPL